MSDSRSTQRGRILDVLIAARGDWVPLPKIMVCAAQYNARVYELRRMGFVIRNRTREIDGVRHSWFRLEPGASQPIPAPAATTPAVNLPLFGEGGR